MKENGIGRWALTVDGGRYWGRCGKQRIKIILIHCTYYNNSFSIVFLFHFSLFSSYFLSICIVLLLFFPIFPSLKNLFTQKDVHHNLNAFKLSVINRKVSGKWEGKVIFLFSPFIFFHKFSNNDYFDLQENRKCGKNWNIYLLFLLVLYTFFQSIPLSWTD